MSSKGKAQEALRYPESRPPARSLVSTGMKLP